MQAFSLQLEQHLSATPYMDRSEIAKTFDACDVSMLVTCVPMTSTLCDVGNSFIEENQK